MNHWVGWGLYYPTFVALTLNTTLTLEGGYITQCHSDPESNLEFGVGSGDIAQCCSDPESNLEFLGVGGWGYIDQYHSNPESNLEFIAGRMVHQPLLLQPRIEP